MFEHKCQEEEDDEHLTPFERFKKTPAYQEILKRQKLDAGKSEEVKKTEEAKDEEAPVPEKKEAKRASKRLQK